MKNLKVALTAVALSAITFTNAANKSLKDDEITKELSVILAAPSLTIEDNHVMAKVSFSLNADRSITVERVNTKQQKIAAYIEQKLEQSSLETKSLEVGKIYTVNVRIESAL